ncbi:MAG: HIT family protein [Candidatus Moraniibacteriota bacterium]
MKLENKMICPFCNINEKRNKVIDKSEKVSVIFSNPRLMPGHILVIPKRHIERISELDDEERTALMEMVAKWEEKIVSKISLGCDVRQNYRPFQKQSNLRVNHLHVHLQPRNYKDELFQKCQIHEIDIFKDLEVSELDKISELLEK